MYKIRVLKITFLGTGTSQGIPIIGCTHPVCLSKNKKDKRLRSSVLIEWENYAYVIDCGPDFRYQMLRAGCTKLNGILFTHEHSDHVLGLDDIRPFNFMHGDMPIYAHKRVLKHITKRFDYIFKTHNKYPGAPTVIKHRIKNKPFNLNGFKVTPINGKHGKLQVFGFKIGHFAYITDMKTVKEKEIEKIKNIPVLVVNALRVEPHHSHFNLNEALDFIKQVNPKTAYLTHISHMLGFHDEVELKLPKHIHLAYDGLQISI